MKTRSGPLPAGRGSVRLQNRTNSNGRSLYDLEIYLRNLTYGMTYITGKIQMEELIADVASQAGSGFNLGSFHDEFLSKGLIPISLIRWEMTGITPDWR